MSDKKGANDPSMDEILASVRKIVSDDDVRGQAIGRPAPPTLGFAPARAPAGARPPAGMPSAAPVRDDVLLLTDLIEEPEEPVPPVPPSSPAPVVRLDSQSSDQPLLADGVAGAAVSAFDRLNQAVRDTVPPPAAPDAGPALGSGGKTIEDLVKEMLRPMLKEWLDRNLPPMVERFVEREIVRLTRR